MRFLLKSTWHELTTVINAIDKYAFMYMQIAFELNNYYATVVIYCYQDNGNSFLPL